MQPEVGESYYAIVKSSKGVERKFNLPATVNNGVALHLVSNRGKIYYEMKNHTALPNEHYNLLVHSRGRALALFALKDSVGQVSEALLPPGIVSFSVIDTLYNTYCERLFFIPRTTPSSVSMVSDKAVYGKRQAVNLDLNLQSATGKVPQGNFSISVTDSKMVKLDSVGGDILSYLLLSSDIKGYIEEPGSYFSDNTVVGREKLDVLMLTQGWKRFSTANVVKANFKEPSYYMEVGQALTGKVLDVFNKPAKKCGIIMLSPMKGLIKLAQTDSLGRYLIDGFEFADSTSFVLKAKRDKGFGDVEIIPDADVFPASSLFIPTTPLKTTLTNLDYFQQSKEKYYSDGGMRVVDLSEVTIKAAKKNKNETTHFYSGMETNKLTAEKLADYPGMTVLELLSMMPGIQVNGDQVSIRNASGNPTFYIDDIESLSMDDITYLNSSDIEEISVFKGPDATIFGSKGANGVVAIALKKGYVRKAETAISMTTITPLGLQKPAAFYVPKYNVDSVRLNRKSDLRTTIYWNPELVTDSTGTVHVKFYSADKANNYSVVLEGVSSTGEIFRYEGVLRREGE
jgi:TonB-dependent SusC/RagA subfamily outer membrane receptor